MGLVAWKISLFGFSLLKSVGSMGTFGGVDGGVSRLAYCS